MQSIDNVRVSYNEILEILESQIKFRSLHSQNNYKKVLSHLKKFINFHNTEYPFYSREFLVSWICSLFLEGCTKKTTAQYLNVLAALYKKAEKQHLLPSIENFKEIKKIIYSLPDQYSEDVINNREYQTFLEKIKYCYNNEADNPVIGIIIYALLNPQLKVGEIAALRNNEINITGEEEQKLISGYRRPRHKYVFPLNQSRLTPRQITVYIEGQIQQFFSVKLIKTFGNVDQTLRTYWLYASFMSGLDPWKGLGVTGSLPYLNKLFPCEPVKLDSEENLAIRKKTGESLLKNDQKWYALRFRPGIRYRNVLDAKNKDGRFTRMELFYPMEEIAVKCGNKFKFKNKGILGNIFFIKSCLNDKKLFQDTFPLLVRPYLSKSRREERDIVVSEEAMETFQRTIAQFSSDMEIGRIGTLEVREGDKIVVIGGSFQGMEGEFLGKNQDQRGIIYRIRLFGDKNDIEWRVRDSRLIKKQ